MALQEDHREQTQRKWRFRLAREREQLSASVTEALHDPTLAALVDEEIAHEPGLEGESLIRPRLTLRSRAAPAVPHLDERPTHLLGRLTQRIAASFTTFSAPIQQSILPAVDLDQLTERYQPEKGPVHSLGASAGIDVTPFPPPLEELLASGNRPRLAGMTRVRLQTPDAETEVGSFPTIPLSRLSSEAYLPVEALQTRQLVIPPLPPPPSYPMRTHLGTGIFEGGQQDISLLYSPINQGNVVFVMLMANPGPVVVQYVTIQPQMGFTVHLTAPAANRTPFNFAVL